MTSNTVAIELGHCEQALAVGNTGLARVCARRAVGAAIVELHLLPEGTSAMAALRWLAGLVTVSMDVRQCAATMLLGERARAEGASLSQNPLADARLLIAACSELNTN